MYLYTPVYMYVRMLCMCVYIFMYLSMYACMHMYISMYLCCVCTVVIITNNYHIYNLLETCKSVVYH